MNLSNRRLKEVQSEKRLYRALCDQADNENDRQIYKGKIKCLEEEEKNILKRYDVII